MMKVLLIISLLILVTGCFLAWLEHGRLPALKDEYQKLTRAAADLGIRVDDGNLIRNKKSRRSSAKHSIDRVAAAFILECNELTERFDEHQRAETQPDEVLVRQQMELMQRMSNLQPNLAKAIVAELRQTTDTGDEKAQEFAAEVLMILGAKNPELALSLSLEHRDFFGGEYTGGLIREILEGFTRQDPEGALGWLQRTEKTTLEVIGSDVQSSVLVGIGRQDPARAFALAEEFFPDETGPTLRRIVWAAANKAAGNGAARSGILDDIRAQARPAELEGSRVTDELLSTMGSSIVLQGFDTANAWMKTANLTDAETQAFARGIAKRAPKNSRVAWSKWLGENLSPTPDGQETIRTFVSDWTDDDYQSAGEWLIDAKDGAIKHAAVEVYAAKIARYEPDSAEEWARILPDGPAKETLLDDIQQHRVKITGGAAEE